MSFSIDLREAMRLSGELSNSTRQLGQALDEFLQAARPYFQKVQNESTQVYEGLQQRWHTETEQMATSLSAAANGLAAAAHHYNAADRQAASNMGR